MAKAIHNPDNLSAAQIGFPYRLLDQDEIWPRVSYAEIEIWDAGKWHRDSGGCLTNRTYRTVLDRIQIAGLQRAHPDNLPRENPAPVASTVESAADAGNPVEVNTNQDKRPVFAPNPPPKPRLEITPEVKALKEIFHNRVERAYKPAKPRKITFHYVVPQEGLELDQCKRIINRWKEEVAKKAETADRDRPIAEWTY